jgi:hypothetical protein
MRSCPSGPVLDVKRMNRPLATRTPGFPSCESTRARNGVGPRPCWSSRATTTSMLTSLGLEGRTFTQRWKAT